MVNAEKEEIRRLVSFANSYFPCNFSVKSLTMFSLFSNNYVVMSFLEP